MDIKFDENTHLLVNDNIYTIQIIKAILVSGACLFILKIVS